MNITTFLTRQKLLWILLKKQMPKSERTRLKKTSKFKLKSKLAKRSPKVDTHERASPEQTQSQVFQTGNEITITQQDSNFDLDPPIKRSNHMIQMERISQLSSLEDIDQPPIREVALDFHPKARHRPRFITRKEN